MARTIRALAGITLATSITLTTLITTPAPPAEAHTLKTHTRIETNGKQFHKNKAAYYAIRTKAMAKSGKGIRGKAALYLDGDLQRVRVLKRGTILFRIYRNELRDNKSTTVSIRIFPTSPHREDRLLRREITDKKPKPKKTSSSQGDRVMNIARQQLGKPYKWGGAGPGSYDCSGLVTYAYRVGAGKKLPHYSGALRNAGRKVTNPRRGDISWTSGHVSLCANNGCTVVIEAANPGTRVRRVSNWQRNPTYIRP